jgi:signal transduction histidine kinase
MGLIDTDRFSADVSSDILPSLFRIARLAGRAESTDVAFDAIINELHAFFAADRASICLINPNSGLLEPEVARGYPDGQVEATTEPGRGISGWVVFHNQPMLVSDVTAPDSSHPAPKGVRCRMCVPMSDHGQVLGAINIDASQPGRFTEGDLERLEVFCREITPVLQRLWSTAHLNIMANQLEVLTNIGQTLVTKLDQDELLSSLARETREITRSRLCTIQLYDPDAESVRLQTAHPEVEETDAREWSIHASLASAPVHTRKQVEFRRIQSAQFAEVEDLPPDPTIQSVLSTPILSEREVIGVIHVFTDGIHRFTNGEKRLVSALASLASVGIENARLYSRVFDSEESLRRNEKLTTLGLLAAEIAHEIRNPLTVLKLLFGSLKLEFPEGDPRSTDARIIQEKLNQLESIVGRVLSFGKAPESLYARWNLDEIIRETCLLVRLKLHQSKIRMHYEPPATALMVNANKGQLQQVLLNLLLNATAAMPAGGDITIRAREELAAGGRVAVLEIEDTGTGIPDAIRPNIFSSFLSPRTEGSGLGLAIVKRIMQSHHGEVDLVRSDSNGTLIRLELPEC